MAKKRRTQVTSSSGALGAWLETCTDGIGRRATTKFVRVYPPIAQATSLAEAVFWEHFLFMWTAKRDEDEYGEGGTYLYEHRPNYGIYLFPSTFCRNTGLSRNQFYSIVKKYEELRILRTKVDVAKGNRKYYRLTEQSEARLFKYLTERLSDVWQDVATYEDKS